MSITKPTSEKREKRDRLTIGLITHRVFGPWEWWDGAVAAAQRHDVNLVTFRSGLAWIAESDDINMIMTPVLNELVSDKVLDGLVLVQWWPDHQTFETFYERYYSPLPVVNVQRTYEGRPGVIADNYAGMMAGLEHLLDVHGHRRLAFVQGPPGNPSAEGRYRAYVDALAARDLSLDETLVTPGNFTPESGERAVSRLLDERNLVPGKDFDALVAANDNMVLGALEAFQRRGVNVPKDVALLGFDDIVDAQLSVPSITTVTMPNRALCELATEMLIAIIRDGAEPSHATVPAQLVVRRSCGCFSDSIQAAALPALDVPGVKPSLKSLDAMLADRREQALEALAAMGDVPLDAAEGWAARLLDALAADLRAAESADVGEAGSAAFLPELYDLVHHFEGQGLRLPWQAVLSTLRQHSLVCVIAGGRVSAAQRDLLAWVGSLWEQARVLVEEARLHHDVLRRREDEARQYAMRSIGEQLITTFDLTEMLDLLASELPQLGVTSCYLSLYANPQAPGEQARLMLAYNEQGRVDLPPDGRAFPARFLVPPELLSQERAHTMLVEPLYFRQEALGFIIFEGIVSRGETYTSLARQISSALKGALLVRQQERAQRQAQAAQEETQRALYNVTMTRRITDRVRRAADTEAILRVALEELGQVLGASVSVARLGTRDELLEGAQDE